jgi:hypothetical protein
MLIYILFNLIEFIAFILPALPDSLTIRLCILLLYFIGHCFKLQTLYSKIKLNYITTRTN